MTIFNFKQNLNEKFKKLREQNRKIKNFKNNPKN